MLLIHCYGLDMASFMIISFFEAHRDVDMLKGYSRLKISTTLQ